MGLGRVAVIVAVGLLVLAAGCSEHGAAVYPDGDQVEGIVTEVTVDAGTVTAFVVRTSDDHLTRFVVGTDPVQGDLPLDDLRDYVVSGESVVVVSEDGPDGLPTVVAVFRSD